MRIAIDVPAGIVNRVLAAYEELYGLQPGESSQQLLVRKVKEQITDTVRQAARSREQREADVETKARVEQAALQSEAATAAIVVSTP